MNERATAGVDLGFSRWASAHAVQAVAEGLGVLVGVALVAWAAIDAVTSHHLEADARVMLVGMGLAVTAYFAWSMRDVPAFLRSRLLVGAAGVRLDSRDTPYRWTEIAGFEVTGPHDFMGLPAAGAVMRLHDGRRMPIERLEHLGGDGRNSDAAIATIAERVATMNALLADATTTATSGR
jgi:hypothetical protein